MSASSSNTSSFKNSFDATAKDRAELFRDDFLPINLDVQVTLTTVLGALPRLRMLREEIVAQLPKFELGRFDSLEAYAEALSFANTAYLAASQPSEALPALTARAMGMRDLLLSDAQALAKRGLVDGKRLADLKGGPGYLNTGSDIGVLVRIFRDRWSEIQGKSAVQQNELDEAENLYERITHAVAERTQESTNVASASEDRQRAFTLLVNAYDQARRAASYIRWKEEDVEKYTPSLWQGRGTRNDRKVVTPPVETPPGSPVSPANVAPASPEQTATPAGSGLPGGSPFVQN